MRAVEYQPAPVVVVHVETPAGASTEVGEILADDATNVAEKGVRHAFVRDRDDDSVTRRPQCFGENRVRRVVVEVLKYVQQRDSVDAFRRQRHRRAVAAQDLERAPSRADIVRTRRTVPGSTSQAITSAPRSARCSERKPKPAPMSRTVVVGSNAKAC